jgi:hypothetical protein
VEQEPCKNDQIITRWIDFRRHVEPQLTTATVPFVVEDGVREMSGGEG